MVEREVRKSLRREGDFRLEYTVISGSSMLRVIEARTLDFSLTGARILTSEPIEPGDRLSVRIEVPDLQCFEDDKESGKKYKSTAVMCFGRVRWIDRAQEKEPGSVGIRFEQMTEPDRQYLGRLLEQLIEGSSS